MAFTMRTTKPEAGNKYYITKSRGGYSDACQGSPTDPNCNVLSNCVGYAYGRFNEIGQYGYCKYLRPVNAENFMQYASGLQTGQTPQVGACMVWQKGATLNGSDGAGHVAIVEKVISSTQVMTSESGWGASNPFWTQIRNKGSDDRWGMSSNYTFLGFIYNPAVSNNTTSTSTSNTTTNNNSTQNTIISSTTFKVGDIVDFTGTLHYGSSMAKNGLTCKAGKAKITLIALNTIHPYHLVRVAGGTSTVYGWVSAADVKAISTSNSTTVSTPTNGRADEKKIWDYLYQKIQNPYGVAGIMGNMEAESALIPTNLQDSYESKLGMTNSQYTEKVDNGSYTNFIYDTAGYGLVQWTYWSLKKELFNYAKSHNKSIGDLDMQLEFLCHQLSTSYPSVWNTCKKATSVLEASNAMLLKFECPANQGAAAQSQRANFGLKFYNKFTNSSSTTTNETVKVTANVLNIRSGPSTSYSIVGSIKDKGAYVISEKQNNWGRLQSGAGWICLDYTVKE